MTTISNKMFGGVIPRTPADKLPDDKAQVAVNCNFAYGEMRPLQQPFQLTSLANAAKSIFSVDGTSFYSWPWRTKAWKGPVISDSYYRMYFTGLSGDMRVAQTFGMKQEGGEPATSYMVGVPAVATAPSYELVDRDSLPDYTSAVTEVYYLYELEGKRYSETLLPAFSTVKPYREFTLSVPKPTYATSTTTADDNGNTTTTTTDGIPQGASLAIRIDVKDTIKNALIFSITTSVTSATARSDGVPGGVEATLKHEGESGDDELYRLNLTYGVMETRAYVVTMVNQWVEESKPSPPVVVEPTYMQAVRLTFDVPDAAGYVPLTKFRLYRSTDTGDYLSVGSATGFSSTPVSITDTAVGIVETDATLSSTGWDMPPQGMRGLTLMPNGFFAGFVGDTLYFSEPYRPWAWPYSMSFPYGLVGMRAVESALVVTTIAYPYMVSGVHPSAMSQAQLSMSQAGVSDHGMTVVGNTVTYISNDGLVNVQGYDVSLAAGQSLWTREVWRKQFGGVLSDLELAYHDGSLVCGCSTAGKMWEIRLDSEGGGNLTFRDSSTYSNALYVLPASDQLYEVRGNKLYQHNGSSAYQSFTWQGKDHILGKPTLFTAGYINCEGGSVTVTVYADGAVRHTQTFSTRTYFRMPGGKRAIRWSISIAGTGTVKEISLAERRQELANV